MTPLSRFFFFFSQLFLVFHCYSTAVNIFIQPALRADSVSEESVPRNGNQAHFLMWRDAAKLSSKKTITIWFHEQLEAHGLWIIFYLLLCWGIWKFCPWEPFIAVADRNRLKKESLPERRVASLVAQRVKHLPTMRETWVWSLGREDLLEKEMATHSSTLLPGKFHGPRSLVGYSPWGCKESETTERLHFFLFLKGEPCMLVSAGRQVGCLWGLKLSFQSSYQLFLHSQS